MNSGRHFSFSMMCFTRQYSSVEGTTIEKHLINLKIERVKELLVDDEKHFLKLLLEWDITVLPICQISLKR